MGFQGMRGKKDYLIPDFEDSYFREDEKRAPMGFQGMRGKKATLEDEYYKRAPMGFQGMRGKKSLEEVNINVIILSIVIILEVLKIIIIDQYL